MLTLLHFIKMEQNEEQENNKVDLEKVLIGIGSKMESKCC